MVEQQRKEAGILPTSMINTGGPGNNVADARLVHKTLINTKIPLKRSFQQRQPRKRTTGAYRDDEDHDMDDDDEGQRTTQANNDGNESDSGLNQTSAKRQNRHGTAPENEYDSPPEDADENATGLTEA